MSYWQKHTEEDRLALLKQTADQEGINLIAVEKDWWVTVALKALFQTSCAEYLLFKGGTSLSKGWDLIQRFSEDIDLAIDHSFFKIHETNKSQREKLRKNSRNYIHSYLSKEFEKKLEAMQIAGFTVENITTIQTAEGEKPIASDKDPTVIHLNYRSILDTQIDYIPPRVKIEISCLSMAEPCEIKNITSLIYSHFPAEDNETASAIKTVLPSRTFLEKAFLLNEEFQKPSPRHLRMSRHLYDLEKLMDTIYGKEALADSQLYTEIVKHRYIYYADKKINYQLHHPTTISFLPKSELLKEWMNDYNEMKSSFIYGNALSFEQLIKRMQELQSRFQEIKTKENLLE